MLDFYLKRSVLEPELGRLQSILSKKAVLPILENILIQSLDRHTIQFAATNLNTTMVSNVTADQIVGEGRLCLPARRLFELSRLLPEGMIHIVKEEGKQVLITSGRSKNKLPDADPEDFPPLPVPPTSTNLSFSAKALRAMIRGVEHAIAPEEHTVYVLKGVKFESNSEGTTMVGADGHRLAIASMPAESLQEDDLDILIPERALDDFGKLTADYDDQVKIAVDGNSIHFIAGPRSLSAQLLAGDFPQYQKIVSAVRIEMKDVLFQGGELAQAIKRAALAADIQSAAVTFDFTAEELALTAKTSKTGESQESIVIVYDGDPIKMNLNANYVLDFLANVDGGEVVVGIRNATKPLCLRSKKENISFSGIISPMEAPT